jgi:hypothetical protein
MNSFYYIRGISSKSRGLYNYERTRLVSHRWIMHRGKRILYGDYRELKGEEIVQGAEALVNTIVISPKKVLVLYNFENALIDSAAMTRLKQLSLVSESRIKKFAILGSEGLVSMLLKASKAFSKSSLRLFNKEAAAMDWLSK